MMGKKYLKHWLHKHVKYIERSSTSVWHEVVYESEMCVELNIFNFLAWRLCGAVAQKAVGKEPDNLGSSLSSQVALHKPRNLHVPQFLVLVKQQGWTKIPSNSKML